MLALPPLRALAAAALLACAAAQAQQAAQNHERYDLPTQPLGSTLARIAAQSGQQISVEADLVRGLQAPAVRGSLSAEQAARAALAGSGLELARTERGNWAVRRAVAGAAPAATATAQGTAGNSAAALPEVRVTAQAVRADGLPQAYAGGQVARGGRVGLLGNADFLETPFSTINYTSEHVQNLQAQEVGRVIGAADPTVVVPQNRHSIQEGFLIRGYNVTAYDITFNGLPAMAPTMRSASEIAERIEVLKGPSALLNGMPASGTIGGSINLVPKRAADEPLARLTASHESDGLWGVHADVGRRFGAQKELGIRFNGVVRDGNTAVDNQQQDKELGALALDWRGERLRLSLDAYKARDRLDAVSYFGIGSIVDAVTRLPRPLKGDAALVPPWTFNIINSETVVLRGEADLTERITAYAAWGRRTGGYNALIDSSTLLNDAGDISSTFVRQATEGTQRSWELGLRGELETGPLRHRWSIASTGYDTKDGYRSTRFARNTNFHAINYGTAPDLSGFSATGIAPTGANQLRSVALADTVSFAQDRVHVTLGVRRQEVKTESLNATTGVRSPSYDKSATTPSLAVLVKATERLALYGNYIEGLSQGGTAPATAANANEVFPPFKTRQHELGAKYDFGSFAVTTALFQIVRPSAYTDPATNRYGYHGEQRNRGLEISFFGEASKGLRLIGGVAYTPAQLRKQLNAATNGNQVTGVPKFVAKLGADYDLAAVPGLTLTGNVNYSGKRYATLDNRLSVDAYTTIDVGARYATRIARTPVTLRANVHNLTNKAYWAGNLSNGLGAPRTFLLSASVDF